MMMMMTDELWRLLLCSLSLLQRLNELWSAYENEMDTSVSDFLSLHHLGSVLNHLAHLGMYVVIIAITATVIMITSGYRILAALQRGWIFVGENMVWEPTESLVVNECCSTACGEIRPSAATVNAAWQHVGKSQCSIPLKCP